MRLLLIVPILAFPLVVRADPDRTPDAAKMHTDDCAKARKQHRDCVIDMGKGEEIGGNGVSPNGIAVGVLDTTKHPSLIHIRRDFIVEMLKTADDL